jgi:hypothetical protein
VVIGQEPLDDVGRILHRANQIGHWLKREVSVPVEGGATAKVDFDFFLAPPSVTLAEANADRPELGLAGWGDLAVTLPGSTEVRRRARMSMRVLVPTTLTIRATELTIDVDGLNAVLDQLEIESIAGGAFPADVEAFLKSTAFRNFVQSAVAVTLLTMKQLGPPIDVSFLVAASPGVRVGLKTRVLDGALAIGLDLTRGPVTTAGDATKLSDFRDGSDFAIWINPVASPVVFDPVRAGVDTAVKNQGGTLDWFDVVMEEGHLLMMGAATKPPGWVSFSIELHPRLYRPGTTRSWTDEDGRRITITTPPREELWFQVWNVRVDVHRDWWVSLLEGMTAVFTLGLSIAFVEMMVGFVRGSIVAGIARFGHPRLTARSQEFTFLGTTEPNVRLRIERCESHTDGMSPAFTLRPQWRGARLKGQHSLLPEEMVTTRPRYEIELPAAVHPDDPQVRVRWTLRRLDRNEVIANAEAPAATNRVFHADVSSPAVAASSAFSVACRVYRALGGPPEELFNDMVTLPISDRLDRSRPYVRWNHAVNTPVVQVESDGTHTILGHTIVQRRSAIHRTAVPGRCRMVARYSSKVRPAPTPGHDEPHLEYLDRLPFPTSDLLARRDELCDYCFFGGPTKTVPLIPIP